MSFLYILLALLLFSPIYFYRSVKESYGRKFNLWDFLSDLPVWAVYLWIVFLTCLFWAGIIYLIIYIF